MDSSKELARRRERIFNLKMEQEKALQEHDYDTAARLRDEIRKLKSK